MKKVISILMLVILVAMIIPAEIFAYSLSDDIPAPSFECATSKDYVEFWLSDDIKVDGYTIFFY